MNGGKTYTPPKISIPPSAYEEFIRFHENQKDLEDLRERNFEIIDALITKQKLLGSLLINEAKILQLIAAARLKVTDQFESPSSDTE